MLKPKRRPSLWAAPRAEPSAPWLRGLIILAWVAPTWGSPRRSYAGAWHAPRRPTGQRWSG
eukprot:6328481-Alexandrium_andersonii.AAC.1